MQSHIRRRRSRAVLPLVAALSIAFAAPSPASADPKLDPPPGARNVTAEWQTFTREGSLDADRVESAFATVRDELRSYRVVIVPSYLSGLLIDAGELRLTDYMRAPLDALRAEGIDTEFAPVDTEQSVAENGRRLAAFVASGTRPVCFISHSKGGLDTLEFLLRSEPELRRQVACWVVLQSPFAGSPVADLIVNEDWTRGITEPMLRALGGSGRSIDDLTVKVRTKYMRDNAALIGSITRNIPMVALATYVGDSRTPSLHIAPTQLWMAREGLANDGLVPVNSVLLPNTRYVVLPGLDHTDPVARKPIMGNPIDRVLLWKSLLYLALSDRPT